MCESKENNDAQSLCSCHKAMMLLRAKNLGKVLFGTRGIAVSQRGGECLLLGRGKPFRWLLRLVLRGELRWGL